MAERAERAAGIARIVPEPLTDRALGTAAATVVAMLYGSTYVATAFQLRGFTPLGGALWRSAIAAVILLAVVGAASVRGRGRAIPDSARAARWARLLVLGILGGPIFIVGLNVAVSQVGATVTSFVAGLYAILATLFAPAVLGERLERSVLAGFVAALAGTALLAGLSPSPNVPLGLAAAGSAAVAFSLYLVLIRRWSASLRIGPMGIALSTVLAATAVLAVLIALFDPGAALPSSAPPNVVAATAWLVVSSVAGPILAAVALGRIETRIASALLLLNPVTATVLAMLTLGEVLTPIQAVGGLLVLVGMGAAALASRR